MNPNPLANPLNDRPIGNVRFTELEAGSGFKADRNARLPEVDAEAWQKQQQVELHVPEVGCVESELQQQMYWREVNGVKTLCFNNDDSDWRDSEIMNLPNSQLTALTPEEIARQQYLNQKVVELLATMSDQQKALLANIESFVGKSRFVEED